MSDGTIKIDTLLDDSGLTEGLKKLRGQLSAASGVLGSMANKGAMAFVGLAGAIAPLVKLSSDAGESFNAMNTVFQSSSKIISDWSKNAVKEAGLTAAEFNQTAAVIGAGLINAGASTDTAAQQTIELTKRAADMASIFNTDVNDAMGAMQAALRGESEPIRRYAISLNETEVAAKAVAMGLAKNVGSVDAYGKSQARLAIIMEQSSRYQGDFVRTSDQLANSTRVTTAMVKQAASEAGTVLLPAVLNIIQSFITWATEGDRLTKVLTGFANMVSAAWNSGLIPAIAAFLAVLKIASVVIPIVSTAIAVFNGAIAMTQVLIMAIPLAIAALIAGIILLVKNWDAVTDALLTGVSYIKTGFLTLAKIVVDKVLGSISTLLGYLGKIPFIGKYFKMAQEGIDDANEAVDTAILKMKEDEKATRAAIKAERERRKLVAMPEPETPAPPPAAGGTTPAAKASAEVDAFTEKWESAVSAVTDVIKSAAGESANQVANLASGISSVIGVIASKGSDMSAWAGLGSALMGIAKDANITGIEELGAAIDSLVTNLVSALAPIIKTIIDDTTWLANVFGGLISALSPIIALIEAIADFAMAPIEGIIQGILDVIIVAIDYIGGLVTALYNGVVVPVYNAVQGFYNDMYNGFVSFLNGIIDFFNRALGWLGVNLAHIATVAREQGMISALGGEAASEHATDLEDVNAALKKNKELFTKAENAADAYDAVLTSVTDSASSFFESLKDVGKSITDTLISALVDGLDGDDFMYALEEYIRKAVIQAAVFTDSFMASVSEIGTKLATAIATGDTSSIAAIKDQLAALYATAAATAQAATSAVSGAFGSYAVGSLGLPGDGLIYAHGGEIVLPSGISQEARAAGIYIGPTSGMVPQNQKVVVALDNKLVVDGREIARAAVAYEDDIIGAAYGY